VRLIWEDIRSRDAYWDVVILISGFGSFDVVFVWEILWRY